jgi:hypothetical protein
MWARSQEAGGRRAAEGGPAPSRARRAKMQSRSYSLFAIQLAVKKKSGAIYM